MNVSTRRRAFPLSGITGRTSRSPDTFGAFGEVDADCGPVSEKARIRSSIWRARREGPRTRLGWGPHGAGLRPTTGLDAHSFAEDGSERSPWGRRWWWWCRRRRQNPARELSCRRLWGERRDGTWSGKREGALASGDEAVLFAPQSRRMGGPTRTPWSLGQARGAMRSVADAGSGDTHASVRTASLHCPPAVIARERQPRGAVVAPRPIPVGLRSPRRPLALDAARCAPPARSRAVAPPRTIRHTQQFVVGRPNSVVACTDSSIASESISTRRGPLRRAFAPRVRWHALASFSVPNTVVPACGGGARASRDPSRPAPRRARGADDCPSALDGTATRTALPLALEFDSSPRADHPAASESAHSHSHSHGDHAHAHPTPTATTPTSTPRRGRRHLLGPPPPRRRRRLPTYAPRNPLSVAPVTARPFCGRLRRRRRRRHVRRRAPRPRRLVSALETQLAKRSTTSSGTSTSSAPSARASPRLASSSGSSPSRLRLRPDPCRDVSTRPAFATRRRPSPLARGEASVHGVPESTHFHEGGAVDSIVDIVAVAAGWKAESEEVVVPTHGRRARRARHPCPPPATVCCLRDAGVPTHDPGADGEFVTPTGACPVAALATSAERWPDMFLPERCAYGAGPNGGGTDRTCCDRAGTRGRCSS